MKKIKNVDELVALIQNLEVPVGVVKTVGLAGSVGSGKTTFARELRDALRARGLDSQILSFDWYHKYTRSERIKYLAESKKAGGKAYEKSRVVSNWFDANLFTKHISQLRKGQSISLKNAYRVGVGTKDYVVDIAVDKGKIRNTVLIVEGIGVLDKGVRRNTDLMIYIDAPSQERFWRVRLRDSHHPKKYAKELFEITRQYEKRSIVPKRKFANVVVKNVGIAKRIRLITLRRK